jgi:hypothetical protein
MAYQLANKQADRDRVMGVQEEDRAAEYRRIQQEYLLLLIRKNFTTDLPNRHGREFSSTHTGAPVNETKDEWRLRNTPNEYGEFSSTQYETNVEPNDDFE